jgi:uncharacterized membrane protein
MESLKVFGCLFLSMVSCFTLGGYVYATVRELEKIETHRWIMTSLFGLIFLGMFLIDYRKNKTL